jgi:hypothetical protein
MERLLTVVKVRASRLADGHKCRLFFHEMAWQLTLTGHACGSAQPRIYKPSDPPIVKFGEVGRAMYFIYNGTVDVISEDGETVYARLSEGTVPYRTVPYRHLYLYCCVGSIQTSVLAVGMANG